MVQPVRGFRFSSLSAQIRKDGRVDVGLLLADEPARVAGVFTRNLVRAAPVEIARLRVRSGIARAVLVNSGCANACTGAAGWKAAMDATAAVADALGIPADEVLPASTGVIGAVLPSDRIVQRAAELVRGATPEGLSGFATAIRTTDRWEKIAEATCGEARVVGVAKGAGMIGPDLSLDVTSPSKHATMLAFLVTDSIASAEVLRRVLSRAVQGTFNNCVVDGDTSTNDTVLLLASGASGYEPAEEELETAVREVCWSLAKSIVRDGEGTRHTVELRVRGLATVGAARTVARAVATSILVKTAFTGEDANWGRILAAAGRSGALFDPASVRISVCASDGSQNIQIVSDGLAVGAAAEAQAAALMRADEYAIDIALGEGPGEVAYLACDLGHDYVDVNAGYRS